MSSHTLLAADPHLTPVRTRPSLVFAGRGGRRGPRNGRAARRASVLAASRRGHGSLAAAGSAVRRGTRLSLPRRGERQPRLQRRAVWGWRPAIVATLVLLVAAGLGVLQVWPPFAVVMSGSMAPTIDTGDMVVLQRLHAPARIGDVVAVPVPDDARTRYGYPPVVIHRVFRIANGQIRTKGDARPAADPFTVPRTSVDARVIADIPAGGRVLAFFHSGPGLVWLLFGAALLFGLPLLDRFRDAHGREADATAGLRDELATITRELARLQEEQERDRQATDLVLAQVDRLARLVGEALGQARAQAAADALAAAPAGDSPNAADAFAEAGESHAQNGAGPFVQTPARDATCPHATGEPAATAERAAATEPAAEPLPSAKLGRGAAAESAPLEPPPPAAAVALPADHLEPAAASRVAVDSAAADPADAPVRRQVSAPATAPGVLLLEHARVAPAARWDTPPPGDLLSRADWAAPPVRRFQRSGRLVPASQASTAWAKRRTVGISQP